MSSKTYDIKSAAKFLSIGQHRMRGIIMAGQVTTKLVPVKAGSKVMKHMIDESELVKYRETKGQTKDGRKAFVVRVAPDKLDALKKYLVTIDATIEPRYKKSAKKAASK